MPGSIYSQLADGIRAKRITPVRLTQIVPASHLEWSPHLASMVRETDPELFAYLFGSEPALWNRLCAVEWEREDGLHARSCTDLLTDEHGKIVGLVNSFPAAEAETRATASFGRYMAAVDPAEAMRLARTSEELGYLFPPAPKDALVLFNLVVTRQARGSGGGASLLRAAEEKVTRLGLSSIHLDVAVTNPAVGFYERSGFVRIVRTELTGPGTERVPPHFRMVKAIQ